MAGRDAPIRGIVENAFWRPMSPTPPLNQTTSRPKSFDDGHFAVGVQNKVGRVSRADAAAIMLKKSLPAFPPLPTRFAPVFPIQPSCPMTRQALNAHGPALKNTYCAHANGRAHGQACATPRPP
jgi:hypothetical protein